MLRKGETEEGEQVEHVAQVVAFVYAIGGFFLLLLTLRFVGELLGIVSPNPADGSFIGSLVSLLHGAGPLVNNVLCVLLFGGITFFFFAQVYGLWHLKKWSLYVTAASTVLLFVFTLFSIADPSVSPYIGLVSLGSGLFLAYLYNFRQQFE